MTIEILRLSILLKFITKKVLRKNFNEIDFSTRYLSYETVKILTWMEFNVMVVFVNQKLFT